MSDAFDEDDDDQPSAPFWMGTFSDMVTLLLTFFVMLVAMSEVEVKKFKEALSYFQGGTGFLQSEAVAPGLPRPATGKPFNQQRAERIEKLTAFLKAQGLENRVEVNLSDQGLHVVITDTVMFRSGEAELIEPSRTILGLLAEILADDVAEVLVEGHTDDRPIRTERFPSNWELSAGRAASVVRFFLTQPTTLPAARYTAAGYGEHHPVLPNDTAAGRARNRRVEILFRWDQEPEPWPTDLPSFRPTPEPPRPEIRARP